MTIGKTKIKELLLRSLDEELTVLEECEKHGRNIALLYWKTIENIEQLVNRLEEVEEDNNKRVIH